MYSAFIIRVSSQIISGMLGGMAVFCLYYAAWLSNPILLGKALILGGAATVVVYFQDRYLDDL